MGRVNDDGIYEPDESDRDPDDEQELSRADWSGMRDPDSTDDQEG